MLNSVRLLSNVVSQNSYVVEDVVYIQEGTFPLDFYIQLWQGDLGLPFVPSDGATVEIQFLRSMSLGANPTDQSVILQATTPFSDKSIWHVPLSEQSVDGIVTGGVRVVITDTKPALVSNIAGAGVPGADRDTNVVTITTLTPHYLEDGQEVEVAGVSDVGFNGTFTIVSVPTATTFTYAQVASDATSGGGTVNSAEETATQHVLWSNMSIRKVSIDQHPLNGE